jgi:hypothetical protein
MADSGLTEVEDATLRGLGIAADAIGSWLEPLQWQWKGASGILLWLGVHRARLPRDLDVEIRITPDSFEDLLQRGPNVHVDRMVRFLRSERVTFTPGGRRPIVYRVVYEAIARGSVVNRSIVEFILSDQLRARGYVAVPWLDSKRYHERFPASSIERLLAEKLRRYAVKRRGGRINTRWQDLLDMLLVARFTPRPIPLDQLRSAVVEDFAVFNRPMIEHLPAAPAEWLDYWDSARLEDNYEFGSLSDAESRLHDFWRPVIDSSQRVAGRLWDSGHWRWR